MTKEFIPYEQALALKELGFDEPCIGFYTKNAYGSTPEQKVQYWREPIGGNDDYVFVLAPLYQQAFRWFREKYKLDGKPEYFLNDWYCFIINDMKEEDTSRRLFTEFPSYKEAELECLKKLIEIVKEK
jgi:hypothetical protein